MKKTITLLLVMAWMAMPVFAQLTTSQLTQTNNLIAAAVKTATVTIQADYNAKLATRDATIKILRDSLKLVDSKATTAAAKLAALPVIDTATYKTIVSINSILSVINQRITTNKSIADTTIKSLADAIGPLPGRIKVLEDKNSPSSTEWNAYKSFIDKLILWFSGAPIKL